VAGVVAALLELSFLRLAWGALHLERVAVGQMVRSALLVLAVLAAMVVALAVLLVALSVNGVAAVVEVVVALWCTGKGVKHEKSTYFP
jgi:hypothetical protein